MQRNDRSAKRCKTCVNCLRWHCKRRFRTAALRYVLTAAALLCWAHECTSPFAEEMRSRKAQRQRSLLEHTE